MYNNNIICEARYCNRKTIMLFYPHNVQGRGLNGEDEIKGNLFFRRIDWDKIEQREIQPPFKPKIVSIFLLHLFSLFCVPK